MQETSEITEVVQPKKNIKTDRIESEVSISNMEGKRIIFEKRHIAWLRITIGLLYVVFIVGTIIYERNAQQILSRGQELENSQKYHTSYVAYQIVVEKFPLSFSVIEAKQGFLRIEPALSASEVPERLGTTFIEEQLGRQFSPYVIDWLPFATWPLCSFVMLIVLVTRIRRRGLAFVAFIIMTLAVIGSVIQLTWHGFISFEPLVEILHERQEVQKMMAESLAIFCASYVLLLVTALMTLTANRQKTFCRASKS